MSTPRSVVLERTFYTLAAPVLAAAPHLPALLPPGTDAQTAATVLNDVVLGVGIGGPIVVVLSKATQGKGRKLMRLSPVALAAAVEVASAHVPGLATIGAAVAWAAYGCFVLPLSKTSRRRFRPGRGHAAALAVPQPVEEPAAVPEPEPEEDDSHLEPFTRGVVQLWRQAGNPGNTVVVRVDPHPGTAHDMTMLLRSGEHGKPINNVTAASVAAAFGVAENVVLLLPVVAQDGRQAGPGWLEVRVTPDLEQRRRSRPTQAEWWADKVAATNAIPDSQFVETVRDEQRGVTYWIARMPDGVEARVSVPALCLALGVSYDDGRVFVTTAGADVLVSKWDVSPLAKMYPATRELLTPDADGRWVVGFLTNGQPARNRVYTERGAAHGLIVAPTGGGKTQLIALFVCADANFGAVVWIGAQAMDEKLPRLGPHVDRQGYSALFIIRMQRAALALMEIRAKMPWADGKLHDWSPTRPGCPYRPLSLYKDEFLAAARVEPYGAEIMVNAEEIGIKGRKYAIGEKIAGQSWFVQDGFTQLLNESLLALCIPVILRIAPKKIVEMFKSLGVAAEDTPDPLPRSFSGEEAGRIDRIIKGEPEPPSDGNTGGVGWIVPGAKPEVLRTLYMDFEQDIAHLFPDEVYHLTDHEIAELTKLDLWFDWQNEPPRPGEFGDEDEDEDGDDDEGPRRRPRNGGGGKGKAKGKPRGREASTASQALDAINRLTGV